MNVIDEAVNQSTARHKLTFVLDVSSSIHASSQHLCFAAHDTFSDELFREQYSFEWLVFELPLSYRFLQLFCSFTSDLRFVYQMHQSAASSLNVLVKPLLQKIMGAQFICAVNSK